MESAFHTFPAPGTLDDVLGFELSEATTERCRASFEITERVTQPMGLVHGGAYAALAETMVSVATSLAVWPDGNIGLGQSNSSTFLRPVRSGTIHAEGTSLHRGRSSWVWDVSFTDDDGRLCAVARVTVAVRPRPPGSSDAS